MLTAISGIWDCKSSQAVIQFVRRGIAAKQELHTLCEKMMDHSLAPWNESGGSGTDNMTMIVVALLRNGIVHNFDNRRARAVLGGLYIPQRTTNKTIYCVANIVCGISSAFVLLYDDGILVPKDQRQAICRNYNILTLGTSLSFLSAWQLLTQNRLHCYDERRTSGPNRYPAPRYLYCLVCCCGLFMRYTMLPNGEGGTL